MALDEALRKETADGDMELEEEDNEVEDQEWIGKQPVRTWQSRATQVRIYSGSIAMKGGYLC